MSEWKALSSITSKIGSGSTPRGGNSVYSDSGISFIRSQNVLDMDFSTENLAFINDNQAEKLNNVIVEKNDILLNITGDSIARCTVVPEEILPARVNQHVSIIRCKNTEESKYVMYYLQYMKKYLLQISKVGGTRNALTKEAIGKLPIKISDECNEISKILDNIDQKIQINNQINQELEAMAKTLYDYWFVQFDFPDQNGKPYKSSGGKMVYNPELKREIPEGWGVEKLGELIQLERGVTYAKSDIVEKTTNDAIGVLRATNITGNVMDLNDLVYLTKDIINNKQIIKQNETLIVMSSGSKEHLGKNAINYYEEVIGFGAFCSKIVPQKYSAYINTFLQSSEFKGYLLKQSMGTNINNLTNSDILDCRIILPNEEILDKFENMIEKNIKLISNNYIQNQELTQLRDWLLPMLMNGQVKVENYTD